jgi:hypothetical protein
MVDFELLNIDFIDSEKSINKANFLKYK